jgi:predicted aspartyl protease
MRAGALIAYVFLSQALICLAQSPAELRSLYDREQWRDLYDRVQHRDDLPLYKAAVGITFHHDLENSETRLWSLVEARRNSPDAYDATEWLSHLYMYQGRYHSLIRIMTKRWGEFPGKPESAEEQASIAGFRGLPDQSVQGTGPSTLAHERRSTFIPFTINEQPATYFFDTGAWISCMSESEARRLGLEIRSSAGTLGQAAGSRIGFRTAVAHRVALGQNRFQDVSFAVFPDDQEPWSGLPPGKRGLIGIPILLNLGIVRWERDGTIQIGGKAQAFSSKANNLALDNDHLVVTAAVENRTVKATVDTGAATSDLYKPLADMFPDLLKRYGSKGTTEVRGVGHAEKFDSFTLPQLTIHLGGTHVSLSPAHVLMKPIGARCCVGNFGMDLLSQSQVVEFDFGAMTLKLISTGPGGSNSWPTQIR